MRRHNKATNENDPNMTPMLDIVFILLIFFIITASFIQENGITLNTLPSKTPNAETDNTTIAISIDEKGNFLFETTKVETASLVPIIKQAYTKAPDIKLIINADSNAHMGRVISAYYAGRLAGLTNSQIFSTITDSGNI